MIEITDGHYRELAGLLLEAVGSGAFYNGTVCCHSGGAHAELTASLIIYTEAEAGAEGSGIRGRRITDIVPVWWEYHLEREGVEELTDFSWGEFRKFLI